MRILSGIKPTGKLHIGNYFAMLRPIVALQEEGDESFVFIANYHAQTTVFDAAELRAATRDFALDFLAVGLDPEKSVLYRQSDVPEVTELTWLLSNVTSMALLERAHAYKDAQARGRQVNHGVFTYPVLMAADILIVQSDLVPVGRDQKQHIEIARDIAVKFNNTYGEVFTIPEDRIQDEVAVVPGLDGQKMSKSYNNTLEVFGGLKAAKKSIMRIVTDSKSVEEPKDPETSTIFQLYTLFATADEQAEMADRFRGGGMGYGDAKKALFEKFEAYTAPYRERREALAADPDAVEDVLAAGAARAREVTSDTMARAREATGLC